MLNRLSHAFSLADQIVHHPTIQRLAANQRLAQVGDKVLSTERSMTAQAQRAAAEADGEPEYLSPSAAGDRHLKTGPIGHKPVMVASMFNEWAFLFANTAMLYQATQMPGKWFGNEPGQKWFDARPKRTYVYWSIIWAIAIPVMMLFNSVGAWPGWALTGFMAVLATAWIDYYLRRTNRKEVVWMFLAFRSLFVISFKILLRLFGGNRFNGQQEQSSNSRGGYSSYGGSYYHQDQSGYDPALVAETQRRMNEKAGIWNPLDYGKDR